MKNPITIEVPSTTRVLDLVQALVPLGLALTAAGPGRYVAKRVQGHALPPLPPLPKVNCACGNFASVFRDGKEAMCAGCWMNRVRSTEQ